MHIMIWYDVMHIAKKFFKKGNLSFCVSVYGAIHLNIFKTHCKYWMTQHVFAKSGKGLELDKTYKLLFHFFFLIKCQADFTAPFLEWESNASRLHSY